VHTTSESGAPSRTVHTRTSKLELGLACLGEIARQWANNHGTIHPGTTVDLIDTTDGGPVAQLKYNGFEAGTLDAALNTLRANGFEQISRVAQAGESLAKLQ
jgi:hypothetical protein